MALTENKREFMGNWICCWCEREIPSGTGVHNGSFIVKERFCSGRCKNKWNEAFG